MAETKMDIEEPSLETPHSQSETAVKEEAAETTNENEATGHQSNRRKKRKSPQAKKATIHHDCAICGRLFKNRSHLKDHERANSHERPYS
ncbi:unnamed protein product, partial [Cyprideis torosa]